MPATHLLTTKDIVYRNNAAGIKMIIVTGDGPVHEAVLEAQKDSPTVQALALVGREVPQGFLDFRKEIAAASPDWTRPTGKDATVNDDISLLYFTSGTTGMPKMVTHSMTYPLGHIVTARLLAELPGRRPALDHLRHRLGQGSVGEDLRPMALRLGGAGLRL